MDNDSSSRQDISINEYIDDDDDVLDEGIHGICAEDADDECNPYIVDI